MKRCFYCAGELEDAAIMCHHCGKPLTMYKKTKIIPAILFFGILPLIFWWGLYDAIVKHQITLFVILIFGGFPIVSWSLLAWLIYLSKQPLRVSTPQELQAKKDKEGRQALIIAPFLIIALMVLGKKYSNWTLWAFLIFCLLGWIQFLPNVIKEPLNQLTGITFRGLWRILKVVGFILIGILLIWGVIALFSGLAVLSTTNFLLLLILWVILAQGEK